MDTSRLRGRRTEGRRYRYGEGCWVEYGSAQWDVGPRTQIEGSLGKGRKHLPKLEKLPERLERRLTLISLKSVVMSVSE